MLKKIILTAVLILNLMLPAFASAQGLKDAGKILGNIGGEGGEKIGVSADLAGSVATVIKTVLALVGTIFLVLTIYAGILWMTAQGEEEKVTKAKDTIRASVIGLVIIMSAYAITYFVTSRLGQVTSSPSSQTQANCSSFTDQTACLVPRDANGNYVCAWSVSAQTGQATCEPYQP